MEIDVKINIFNWGCVLYYINFIRKLLSFVFLLIFVSFFIGICIFIKMFFFWGKIKRIYRSVFLLFYYDFIN